MAVMRARMDKARVRFCGNFALSGTRKEPDSLYQGRNARKRKKGFVDNLMEMRKRLKLSHSTDFRMKRSHITDQCL